jgi:hypothetical protein
VTKKHLEALAAAIAGVDMPEESRVQLIAEVSAVCASMNPRFNAEVFRKAATPESFASLDCEEV